LLLLTLVVTSTSGAGVSEHVLSVGQPYVDIDGAYNYWRDPTGQQTINEIIRRQYDPRWSLSTNSPPNFQFTPDAIWLRFDLLSKQTDDGDYFLEIGSPFIDDIEVHHVKRNHFGDLFIAQSYRAGDDRQIVPNAPAYRLPVFPIQVVANAAEYVYVKVKSTSSIGFPVRLWQRDAYIPQEQKAQAFYGFFFGLMIVMGFYNLVVWLFIREPMYLCYVFYAMAVVFYQASVSGFGALYLWGEVNWLLDKGLMLSSCLSFLFGALFVWHFLSLKEQQLFYQKTVTTAGWTYLGLLLASLVLAEYILAPVMQIIGVVACIAILIVGVMMAWQGHQMARYFVVAWGVLLVGTIVFTMVVQGVLPRTPLTEYMQPVGMAVEVMLLAVAMALRVNQERDARKEAVKTALELAQKVNAMNSEKLVLYSEDNQVLEQQAVEQDEQLHVMRRELDEVKERLDSLAEPDTVRGKRLEVEIAEDEPSEPSAGDKSDSDPGKIVNIERGRKD